jgi:hypothetical protein
MSLPNLLVATSSQRPSASHANLRNPPKKTWRKKSEDFEQEKFMRQNCHSSHFVVESSLEDKIRRQLFANIFRTLAQSRSKV